jgi:methylglutaconyl-CoA hydratase
MSDGPITFAVDDRGVATIILNRPEKRNAIDEFMIEALRDAIQEIENHRKARVLLLSGRGKTFCAGADLDWMRRVADYSDAENLEDANKLGAMLLALHQLLIPTVALVHGAAMGGGAGLVACCDIAVAVQSTRFAFSEVKLGLIPATISPFVVSAIGARQAGRYFLTGESFDGNTAADIGLVHEVVTSDDELGKMGEDFVNQILAAAPIAITESKKLISDVSNRPIDQDLIEILAQRIANRRSSAEGREGVDAFLTRRKPGWAE